MSARLPRVPKAPPWTGDAVFSECRLYRYLLWRERPGAPPGPWLTFAMLNPSDAGEVANDPTVRKCIGFAGRLGFDRILVVNAFGFITPKPKKLYEAMRRGVDVVGPENDRYLIDAFGRPGRIVAAWGANKVYGRALVFDRVATIHGKDLEAIAITPKTGAPQHPLMAKYVDALVPFEVAPSQREAA
jgi:hypothetical protein